MSMNDYHFLNEMQMSDEERESLFCEYEYFGRIESSRDERPYTKKPFGPGKCPRCGSPTVKRFSRVGNEFYGCSQFPECRGSRNA